MSAEPPDLATDAAVGARTKVEARPEPDDRPEPLGGYGLAIDIGTTTIVMELANRATGAVLCGVSLLNSQARYGADVISRVRASMTGKAAELRLAVQDDILRGICLLALEAHIDPSGITLCAIAANTVMVHLLLGLPCDGFASAPFTPAQTRFPDMPWAAAFARTGALSPAMRALRPDCMVRILPAVSAFIGGDVVAGIATLDLASTGANELLVDLGTNAEMALASGGRIYCASAAAGPAFEGGRISCGIGGIPGAVSSVRMEGSRFVYGLIGGGESLSDSGASGVGRARPLGLCGSGLLDLAACALESGLIRLDGSLSPVCSASGIILDAAFGIRLTEGDVREIQLAKAAIRAGIAVLLSEAGLGEADVSAIHLAGAFGLHLRESSALAVGLLPRGFAGRIHSVGNTSLAGAVRSLLDGEFRPRVDAVVARAGTVELADHPSFSGLFVDSMNFGP